MVLQITVCEERTTLKPKQPNCTLPFPMTTVVLADKPVSLVPIIHELEMIQILVVDSRYGTKLSAILLNRLSEVRELARKAEVEIKLSVDGSLTLLLAQQVIHSSGCGYHSVW